jgi:hypothetical protein
MGNARIVPKEKLTPMEHRREMREGQVPHHFRPCPHARQNRSQGTFVRFSPDQEKP